MGQCCATSSSADASAGKASASDVVLSHGDESPDVEQDGLRRDASQARRIALDVAVGAALEVGEQLPLVGGFVKLLGKVKDIYSELDEKVQEAEEVAVWASRTLTVVRPIQVRLSKPGANGPIDDTMQALVTDVAKTVGELLSVAEHISSGSKPSSFLRTALFRSDFDEAKAAFDLTMKELDTALGVDTNITVHEVKDDTSLILRREREILQRIESLAEKIDALQPNGEVEVDTKERWRGLVATIRSAPANNRPVLIDVAEKVVDGDDSGATTALAAAPLDVRESAAALLAAGVAFFEQQKWPEAIASFKKCVEVDPEMAEAWYQLGRAYDWQNGKKSCEASYEPYKRCIALAPDHASVLAMAHNNLGNNLGSKGDHAGAEQMYRKAIELDPSNAVAHGNLGNLLSDDVRKDYDGAERHYRKAIELDPKFAAAHGNLGNLLSDDVRKDYDGAEKMLRKAIELDPKHAVAHCDLGNLLKDVRKDYDGAIKLYRKAIELDPKYAHACWNLSLLLENQKKDITGAIDATKEYIRRGDPDNDGEQRLAKLRAAATPAGKAYSEGLARENEKKWPEAIAAFQNCVALDANHSEGWFKLGIAYYQQNGGENCEAEYEPYTRCIALDPKHAAAHYSLGNVLELVREDYAGAERHYRKTIELDPSIAVVHNNLGDVLRARKDYASAERCYRKAIELDQSYVDAYNGLGLLLHDVRKDYDGAEKHYRKAIELDPECAMAHNNLGTVLNDVRKDYDGAEKLYRKAIELDPKHASAHDNLGVLLKTVRNDYDGAEKMYRKAIELDPKSAYACWNLSALLESQKNDIPGAIEFTEKYIQAGNPDNDGEQRLAKLRAKLK